MAEKQDPRSAQHWDVLALTCIDGRFIGRAIDWLRQEAGIFDLRTEPGASRAIVESVMDRYRFQNVLDTAVRLHRVRELWLIDHADCMACGGSAIHAGADAELEFHRAQMENARRVLQRLAPDITVRPAYIDWERARFL